MHTHGIRTRLLNYDLASLNSFRVLHADGTQADPREYDRWAKISVRQLPKLQRWLRNVDTKVNILLVMTMSDMTTPDLLYYKLNSGSNGWGSHWKNLKPIRGQINLAFPTQPNPEVGDHARSAWMILHMMFQAGEEPTDSYKNFVRIEDAVSVLLKLFHNTDYFFNTKALQDMFDFGSVRRGSLNPGELAYELATHTVVSNWKPVVRIPQGADTERNREARDEFIKILVGETRTILKKLKSVNKWITL